MLGSTSTREQSPLGRVLQQPFLLGLFLPLQSHAWNPTNLPRTTDWTFSFNLACTRKAEALGFDLVFGLGQWMGKGGYGGEIRFREHALDPLMATAGMISTTERILLISTVHVLYGWHPLLLAKLGATLDHMSGGRWGMNAVFGYKPDELRMFGQEPVDFKIRGERIEEFITLLESLWAADENLTCHGQFWSLEGAFVSPKPLFGRPIMVNAGASPEVVEYAARHSDIMFITSPGGPEPEQAHASLPEHTKEIKETALRFGKDLKLIINPMVICRDTENEAKDYAQAVINHADLEATRFYVDSTLKGKQASWKNFDWKNTILGGNINLIGSPEQIVDHFLKIQAAGCDGVQVSFVDFEPDLAYFGDHVLPLMNEAGLRTN